MNSNREHLYARPLGQLPNDETIRILTSVKDVGYSLSPSEPTWTCSFCDYAAGHMRDENVFKIKLGSSIIRAAAIGSLWRARKHVGFAGSVWPEYLHCEFPDCPSQQKIVYRFDIMDDESSSQLIEFRTSRTVGAQPYVLIPLLGNNFADFALISCFEVYRYYYGYLPSVSRHFFSFDSDGNNPNLFRANSTGRTKSYKTYRIDPLPPLTDRDQKRVAQYLSSKSARKAIGLCAASARAMAARDEPVLPSCHIPISGINKWKVSAQPRELNIEVDGKLSVRRVVAISRIIKCFDERKIHHVISMREQIIVVNNPDIDSNSNRNNGIIPPTIPGADIPVISDKPPGSVVRVTDPDIHADAFERECWDDVSFQRIGTEREITTVWPAEPPIHEINEASTQSDGEGLINTGRLDDGPPKIRRSNKVLVDEETFRTQLEDIFDLRAPGSIYSEDTPVTDLPETLEYLFESAKAYLDSDGGRHGCFTGGDTKDFYPDTVPVYILNSKWGKNTICRASPYKVRRALVLEIPVSDGYVYFFDLEKKEGEKIGIHVMLFNGMTLSTNQIASILYRRLEGATRGWPDRMQFSGEFWTGKLYHYKHISATVKGQLIDRCVYKIS